MLNAPILLVDAGPLMLVHDAAIGGGRRTMGAAELVQARIVLLAKVLVNGKEVLTNGEVGLLGRGSACCRLLLMVLCPRRHGCGECTIAANPTSCFCDFSFDQKIRLILKDLAIFWHVHDSLPSEHARVHHPTSSSSIAQKNATARRSSNNNNQKWEAKQQQAQNEAAIISQVFFFLQHKP